MKPTALPGPHPGDGDPLGVDVVVPDELCVIGGVGEGVTLPVALRVSEGVMLPVALVVPLIVEVSVPLEVDVSEPLDVACAVLEPVLLLLGVLDDVRVALPDGVTLDEGVGGTLALTLTVLVRVLLPV